MRFSDLLHERAIELSLRAHSREEAIEILVRRLADEGRLPDAARAREAVLERERALSTGVGQGVAVPHATLAGIDEPVVAFGRVAEGLDFDALDEKPVNLIFLLLAPESEISMHLKLLSRVSRLCNDPDFREALKNAHSARDVLATIEKREKHYPEL